MTAAKRTKVFKKAFKDEHGISLSTYYVRRRPELRAAESAREKARYRARRLGLSAIEASAFGRSAYRKMLEDRR